MIFDVFQETCGQHPHAEAVVDGARRVSFAELATKVESLATTLRDRWGLGPGAHVVIHLANSTEFVATFFALMRQGSVAVLVNTRWKERELQEALAGIPVRGVVTSRELAGVWERAPGDPSFTLVIEDCEAPPATARANARPKADASVGARPAVILCTSGTTGAPKRVVRSQQGLLANAANVASAIALGPSARVLSVVPFHHANGFSNCLLAPLLHGGTLCSMKRFDPHEAAALVERERIGFLLGSPFIFSQLLPIGGRPLACVHTALSSGAPLPLEVARRCRDQLGLRVRQLFGSSETGTIAIQADADGAPEGCLGRPLSGIEVRLLDTDRAPLPRGAIGEIAIRSPALMSGYFTPEGPSRAGFSEGFFCTGDLGCLDEQGRLLLRGRAKRLINAGGVKLDPDEIAQVIRQRPEVVDCVVYGVPHPVQTEVVAATVQVATGAALDRGGLIRHCRQLLAEYKIPRHLVLTTEPLASPHEKTLAVM